MRDRVRLVVHDRVHVGRCDAERLVDPWYQADLVLLDHLHACCSGTVISESHVKS
jgi:hypothetical protein